MNIERILKEKILQPIINLLKEGVGPEALALAVSLGIVVGVIPLLGSTTIICILLAYGLRLNMPALQLVSYLMFPLQLILFIPFFHAGTYFFEPLEFPASVSQISAMMSHDVWGTVQLFWVANLQALLVWILMAIPTFLILNFIFRRSFHTLFLALSRKKVNKS